MKRILSCILVSLYLISLFCFPASAIDISAETGQIITAGMNELNVRIVVSSYFSQRLAYLRGEDDEIAVANYQW